MKHLATTVLLASALALSACAKKAPDDIPVPPANTGANSGSQTGNNNANAGAQQQQGPAPGSQAHFASVMNGRDVIYFDTDKFNIDNDDANSLRAQAQYLLQYPNRRATIEGHCDERGTRDYNLALGERRANAAKNYLVSLGVPANRLSTLSYGKERPVALGSNEQAWAQNRRAATIVIN